MAYPSTSAELLTEIKRRAGRPSTDAETSDTQWYNHLTVGQEYLYQLFAAHFPEALYGAPTKLSTSDNKVYTFPSSITPMGKVEIRASRNGELLTPGAEWDTNADFTQEGSQIRIPHNKTRTFSDGPYARFITPPDVIDANTEPTLKPPRARILIVWQGLIDWATIGGRRDPTPYLAGFQRAWQGDPRVEGSTGLLHELKSQYFAEGMGAIQTHPYWWRGADLGSGMP